ncbi:hypothetical protein [Actinomadura parmotrematis]|uniref:Uncharacterized protein n=1 Tax=Actinomadura parmotrematis TaxID=2864039 RepID=A0ABS7FXC8_9ACTN|nr:hypothetical protein [Actinomadura parmotrematis]MBW8484635.1 hypothetical protein [Actinomadura parmotrematis]
MTDPASDAAALAKAHQQAAKLRSALRDRDERLALAEKRLAALEGSTTWQAGRLLAGTARNPKRGTRLPRDLYRLWKNRHVPQAAPAVKGGDAAVFEAAERPEDRLLVANPCTTLIVAGVFGAGTRDALADHARTVPLYPHDAKIVLASADADLLLIDTTAGAPGGPWAYLGQPGMYDRDRAVHDLRRIAKARELPVVLWGENPPPTLACLEWDARATAPVQLADLLVP